MSSIVLITFSLNHLIKVSTCGDITKFLCGRQFRYLQVYEVCKKCSNTMCRSEPSTRSLAHGVRLRFILLPSMYPSHGPSFNGHIPSRSHVSSYRTDGKVIEAPTAEWGVRWSGARSSTKVTDLFGIALRSCFFLLVLDEL